MLFASVAAIVLALTGWATAGEQRFPLDYQAGIEATYQPDRAREALPTYLGNRMTLSRGRNQPLIAEERALRERISALKAQPEESPALRRELELARDAYQAFLQRVRQVDREQASLMTVEPLTLSQVQALLPEDAVLLEYFVTQQATILWTVDRKAVSAISLPFRGQGLARLVHSFRELIASRERQDDTQRMAQSLFNQLVRPGLRGRTPRELLIVPHDALHYLPFQALMSAPGRYLIQEAPLYYYSSASLMQFTRAKAQMGTSTLFALGNPDLHDPTLDLRYAEREARTVADLFPNSILRIRREASKATTREHSPRHSLLHFATHADLDETDPLGSALRLVPSLGDDGRLEVQEVFGLDLHASLVVLSACETALGKLTRGDELTGLTRAFIYAGTPSIITTLWKVNDRSSYELMREFYRQFTEGRDKAEALRQAQLATLAKYPHPYYWALLLARFGGMDPAVFARTLAGSEPIELTLPEWDEVQGRSRGASPLRFFRDDDWKINFVGPAGSFLTIGSDAVYQLGVSDQEVAQDNPLRGRIVLVGATFGESRDAFPTPWGIMYGVENHANILHTLLTRSQIQSVAWGASLLLQFVLCLAVSALFTLVRPNRALIISLGVAGLAAFGFSQWGGTHGSYWFDFLTPILAIRLAAGLHDAIERRRVRQSFHQYIGREVADRIYSDDPALRGQRRTVSILFTDLRDFTTLSEAMAADQVAQQLTEYFPLMVEAVQRHRGIINDFIGDAVMAVFGAPLDNPEHALDAVRTARAMQAGLAVLNAGWQARELHTLKMGIGIHTGPVFAGNVGSPNRKKYTVVGDAVNVAARVEGLNKDLGTTLLITSDTYAAVKEHVAVKDCGEVNVKGRRQAVKVYEVLALAEDATGSQRRRRWGRDGGSSWGAFCFWPRRAPSPPQPESLSPS